MYTDPNSVLKGGPDYPAYNNARLDTDSLYTSQYNKLSHFDEDGHFTEEFKQNQLSPQFQLP